MSFHCWSHVFCTVFIFADGSFILRDKKKERKKERKTDRQTDRQKERKREIQKYRNTELRKYSAQKSDKKPSIPLETPGQKNAAAL